MRPIWLLLLLLLGGCQSIDRPVAGRLQPQQNAPPQPAGWQTIDVGLERRIIEQRRSDGVVENQLYLLRIDQAHYQFDIGYSPGRPQTLERWQQQTGAKIVVNGGFFTESYVATGLIVVDGVADGAGYRFGGMLTIDGGHADIRPLPDGAYRPGEPLDAALQSFPLLLRGDGSRYKGRDDQPARRTFIAIDSQGWVVIGISTHSRLTLSELAVELTRHDLDLSIALNLDGGTSSGLLIAEPYDIIPAFILLPTVITVSSRQ